MAVLVTGATGFIGRRLVERLVADGQKVVAVARTINSTEGLTDPLIRWIILDLAEDSLPQELLVGVTSVVHLAGETLGAGEDEMKFLRANEQITIKIAESCTSLLNLFIYASTQGVYGNAMSLAVTENFPLTPSGSAYACSKLNGENWLRWFQKRHGGRFISLRFCGFIEGGGLIDYILEQALLDEDIVLFANGTVVRDYLPINDGIEAIIAALNYSGDQEFVPINIGSGQTFSALEIANIVCSELESVSQIHLIDEPSPQGDFIFCIDRAKRLLSFTPRNLEDSIRNYSRFKKLRKEFGDNLA